MPNQALTGKIFNTGDSSVKNDKNKETYDALAMQKTRLNQAKKLCEETNNCFEYQKLKQEANSKNLEGTIDVAQETNYNAKDIKRKGGAENQFLTKHTKDRDNANPTAIGGVPNVTKGKVSDKIMTNKEVYNEGLNKELSGMRYLIEYMDNNNKKQKL
jgi:hypothetical protein